MRSIRIKYEQLVYIVKCECIFVCSQYVNNCNQKVFITPNEVEYLVNFFMNKFDFKAIKKNKGVGEIVKECAEILENKFGVSYSLFTINLIIKRLAPIVPKKIVKYLDAPLNDIEISLVKGCPISSVSKLNYNNYVEVMNAARRTAKEQGLTLYDWELGQYNNN